MNYFICEDQSHFDLLPFTYTRPVWDLRAGVFTQKERWQWATGLSFYGDCLDYLRPSFANSPHNDEGQVLINGKFWPEPELLRLLKESEPGVVYLAENSQEWLIACINKAKVPSTHSGIFTLDDFEAIGLRVVTVPIDARAFRFPHDIFQLNAQAIAFDFEFLTKGAASEKLDDPYNRVYGADNVYVSPGVKAKSVILNAEDGPVYIGPGVKLGEGSIIHGSHAFGHQAQVSMGAKLRGDSAFGPFVKVGGEVGNSVIMGYSNKGHDGYLGNSVLGYWCNLGADSNTSNLKNNYAPVKLWHYPSGRFRDTGQQFCGLMMGDHSKCGINTMFNTGTVVGVSANIFGGGFPRTFIPSFSWGGAAGFSTFQLKKAFEVAERVMGRRGIELTETDRNTLTHIFEQTASYRRWEKKS